jgi:hypothetical protein
MSTRLLHGSVAWFDMVGQLMCDAAARAALPADTNISLVERYTDGLALPGGLVQGLRFQIAGGKPAFQVGVRHDERGDIEVDVTAAASRELNTLYGADPRFAAALDRLQRSRALTLRGDLARLGAWFGPVHDQIVERTL